MELGNNFATTEAEISDMALRLAGAGKQVGISEAEVLSLSAALSSVGSMRRRVVLLSQGVDGDAACRLKTGGKSLDNFARVAGMTSSQFANAFRNNAAGALYHSLVACKIQRRLASVQLRYWMTLASWR